MIRMSGLPAAEKCGASAALSSEHASGRPAAMGKAFHAKLAGTPDAFRLLGALAYQEREEVGTWKTPTTVEVNGAILDYESATKEHEVGLDAFGNYTDDKASALAWGHLDFAWVREVPVGDGQMMRIAYVADIKKSVWTTPDGPYSLQLHGYGYAFAKKVGADAYCTGIWGAKEGRWIWSVDIVQLDGPMADEIFERIVFADTPREASTGPHCQQCFGRMHCPQYGLPAVVRNALAETVALQDPSTIDTLALAPAEALRLLEWAKAAQEIGERVEDNLGAAVMRGLLVIGKDGKEWRPVDMPGRESLDKEKLRACGVDAETVVKRGEPFKQMRWLKAK